MLMLAPHIHRGNETEKPSVPSLKNLILSLREKQVLFRYLRKFFANIKRPDARQQKGKLSNRTGLTKRHIMIRKQKPSLLSTNLVSKEFKSPFRFIILNNGQMMLSVIVDKSMPLSLVQNHSGFDTLATMVPSFLVVSDFSLISFDNILLLNTLSPTAREPMSTKTLKFCVSIVLQWENGSLLRNVIINNLRNIHASNKRSSGPGSRKNPSTFKRSIEMRPPNE